MAAWSSQRKKKKSVAIRRYVYKTFGRRVVCQPWRGLKKNNGNHNGKVKHYCIEDVRARKRIYTKQQTVLWPLQQVRKREEKFPSERYVRQPLLIFRWLNQLLLKREIIIDFWMKSIINNTMKSLNKKGFKQYIRDGREFTIVIFFNSQCCLTPGTGLSGHSNLNGLFCCLLDP